MKLQEQFEELEKLKKRINSILAKQDVGANMTLAVELSENRMYKKLVGKDTQLYMLEHFFFIALREQSELLPRGIETNIFDQVSSLEKLEEKYLAMEFAALRMELDLEPEEISETVRRVVSLDVSGIAMFRVIQFETAKIVSNVIRISTELLKQGEILRTLVLLKEAILGFPDEDELKLMLAKVWMEVGEFEEACKCLKQIKEPAPDIVNLIDRLEGML